MAEAARAKRAFLTRDHAIGLAWGATVIVACLVFMLFYSRPPKPSPWLRDSTEVVPANVVRWYTFALARDDAVEISATAINGERFNLYVVARPASGTGSFGGFQIIPEYTAENVTLHRSTRVLARGEYHVMLLRTGGPDTVAVPATVRLQFKRAQARRWRSARQRRRTRFEVPAKRRSSSAPLGVRMFFFGSAFVVIGAAPATLSRAAAEEAPQVRDTLVFKNGDRLQGAVLRQTEEEIVFKSERFGEQRVRSAEAVVISAEQPVNTATPAALPVTSAPASAAAAERAEAERLSRWDRFSLGVLTANVRKVFGPWNGRLTFSAESVVDSADRDSTSAEATLRRKWERAEVQIKTRYDYAESNQMPTTDSLRLSLSWRRDFARRYFMHYRPSAEWNRASKRHGMLNEYVLMQQELGAGVDLLTKPTRKIRVGLSQNRFDTWHSAPMPEHASTGVQSIFEEIELRLPWQVGVTQRGVWYPVADARDGWENRIELNKKLTETLSLAFRHETRRHNPDGSAQDFNRLKMLLGFDF